MGRRRNSKQFAKKKADLDKKIENMSAYEYEKWSKENPVFSHNTADGRNKRLEREATLDKKRAAEDTSRKESMNRPQQQNAGVGSLAQQAMQMQQGGGSPKAQTGANPGSYMDRVRRERGNQGQEGYEQYGGRAPKGQGGGSPKGQRPGPPGKPNLAVSNEQMPRPRSPKGMPTQMPRPQGRPSRGTLPFERGVPGQMQAPQARKRRMYNPDTGLME